MSREKHSRSVRAPRSRRKPSTRRVAPARAPSSEALRDSENRYLGLARNLPGIVYRTFLRENRRMEFFNDMLEVLTGYTAAELAEGGDGSLDRLVHPDDRPAVLHAVQEALDRDAPFVVEYRMQARNGDLRHVVDRGRPVRGQDGSPLYIDGAIFDVTERRLAELRFRRINEALLALGPDFRENLQRLTTLAGEMLGSSSAIYNRLDAGRLCVWGCWKAPPGLPAEDAPEGHICYDVIRRAQDDSLFIPDLPSTRYAETDPNVRAYGLRTYLGHVVRCGGTPVGSLCVVFQRTFVPMEEERRLLGILAAAIGREEDRRAAEEEVRRSEARLGAVVAGARDSIFIKDRELRYTLVNPAMGALFGRAPADLVGKTDAELFGPETARHSAEVDRRVLAGESVEEETEKPVGGATRAFHTVKVPLRGADGTIAGICGIARDITGRRKTEAALRESEEKYRALVENFPDIVARFDRESRHLFVSTSVTRVIPIRPVDFTGKTHRELGFSPEHCRFWEETIRSVFETRQSRETEYVHEDAGRRFVFHVRLIPEFGPRGVVTSVLGLARDITDRRNAEEALRDSEARYRSIFENIQDVYYEARLDGTILEVSPSVAAISRYRRDNLVGTSLYSIYEDPAVRDRLLAVLREKGGVRDYEIVLKDRDGSPIPCAISARLMPAEGGRPATICGVMRPIAERKKAEEALRRSQDRLRALLDASPVPIIALAADGTVEDWNKSAERMFGYTREEVLGHRPPIVPESYQATFDGVVANTLAGEETFGTIRPVLCKDGTQINVMASSSCYRDASGKPVGLMTLFMKSPAPGPADAPAASEPPAGSA
jgi:PAS domain S-box-containing protein